MTIYRICPSQTCPTVVPPPLAQVRRVRRFLFSNFTSDCKECYNCGYMKKGVNGDSSKLPELPFCGDFAKPTDIYATCSSDDCCASLKEYFIM